MIQGIYETHVHVRNIAQAKEFYEEKLGLKPELEIKGRGVVFYSLSMSGQVLGIWEKSAEEWKKSHFAFKINFGEIKQATNWLKNRGIETREAFGLKPIEPLVHTWGPMASIYFLDPDGNSLEFASTLPEPPEDDARVIYLSEWEEETQKSGNTVEDPTQLSLGYQYYKPYIPRQKKKMSDHYQQLLSQRINRI